MTSAAAAKSNWRPAISERPLEIGYVLKDVFNARMDRMELMMERNLLTHEKLSNEIKADMDQINKRMDQVEKRMDKMEGRMDRMEGDISDLKSDVKAISVGFAALQTRLALNIALLGIVMGLALAIAQHFWK